MKLWNFLYIIIMLAPSQDFILKIIIPRYYLSQRLLLGGWGSECQRDFFVFRAKHILLYKYYTEPGTKFMCKNWMNSADKGPRVFVMLIFAESFSITVPNWHRKVPLFTAFTLIFNPEHWILIWIHIHDDVT